MFVEFKTQYCFEVIYPTMFIYRLSTVPAIIPAGIHFLEIDKIILKFIWQYK